MAGRHPAQYARYASSNQGGSNNNLNHPFPPQSNSTSATSPYSSSSSPGYHPSNSKSSSLPLKSYTLQPPPRLLPLSKAMPSLGYAGMFPQRPNQDEDILTEENVRNGFKDKPMDNEHTCAHDIVYGKLQDDQQLLAELGSFMVDVLKRKKKAARISGSASFKAPIRYTLTDAKKELWMQELANGVEPLRKLIRNVPHGFKSEKLLDTLAAKQVPLLRATWFIKIVGLSEMSQRSASNAPTAVSQTYQWTHVVNHHLERQLTELAQSSVTNSSTPAPSTGSSPAVSTPSSRAFKARPGTPGHLDNTPKPWVSPEARRQFEQRWSYSTRLTRWQYCEGLLDQRTFLKWSLDSLASSSSFESMWLILVGIVQDYVDEYKRNRTLMKLLIETLIKAYSAVSQCIAQGPEETHGYRVHYGLQRDIGHLLQSLFLSIPDMFVIPKLYYQYRSLFETILGNNSREMAMKNIPDICHVMDEYWSIVKNRNEVFCGTLEENQLTSQDEKFNERKRLTESEGNGETDEGHVVQALDAAGRHIDSGALFLSSEGWVDRHGHTAATICRSIFGHEHFSTISSSTFIKTISVMCRWATTESRYGDWRAYMVSSVLMHWQSQGTTQERRSMLQDALIRFLDDQVAGDEGSDTEDDDMDNVEEERVDHGRAGDTEPIVQSTIFLFDTLIRLDLFSYQKHLLRLIARGDLEPHRRRRHSAWRSLHYLKSFPLPSSAPTYLLNQRRIAVFGLRSGSTSGIEEESLLRMKRLTKLAIYGCNGPLTEGLFGKDSLERTEPVPNDSVKAFELSVSDNAEQELALAMESSTRYVILKLTSDWLLAEVKRYVVKNVQIGEDNWRVMTSPGSCLLNSQQYMAMVRVLHSAKDYQSMIDVTLWTLEKTNERSIYPLVVDTLRRYANIWKLLDLGEKVSEAVWAKHQSLCGRGQRERCLMMYMVQLVQEGLVMTDDRRSQLQEDLQVKQKIFGRATFSLADEIGRLANDPSEATVQAVAESLCGRCQYTTDWIGSVLEASVNALRQAAKVKQSIDFQQMVTAVANLVLQLGNQMTLTGQLDDAIMDWLLQQSEPGSTTPLLEDMCQPLAWFPLLLTLLVARKLVNLEAVLTKFVLPWFERIVQEIHQLSETSWTEPMESKSIQLCKNIVVLVRLIIVQDRGRRIPTGQDQPQDMASIPWSLPNEEVFRLQVRRESQLGSSLEKSEPMFALMEKLVLVATSLPLSSSLLQDLVTLWAALMKISWFRQACMRDLNGVYQRFAHDVEGSTEKMIRRKMLNIVDELIGGSVCSERQPQTPALVQDSGPAFIDKLRSVFLNANQWNEEQCRVQISLLLDNVLLSDEGTPILHSQFLGDGHVAVEMMDTSPAPSAPSPQLQRSHEQPLPTLSEITAKETGNTTNKDLEAFVDFFFSMVLSDEDSKPHRRSNFFQKMLHGLRKPVLLALLNHGVRLLEGQPDAVFPVNVLVIPPTTLFDPTAFDSVQYGRQSRAFLHILQHMMSESVWTSGQRVAFLKTLFDQIKRFKDAVSYYRVMQGAHACYADATRAMQLVNHNVDEAIALYTTEGLPEEPCTNDIPKLTLEDIRTSLVIRLRLVVPFASLIWEHPKEDECNILEWIRVLVPLLGNPIVHGNGSQERLFEFMLDMVSMLIDEVPKDLRKTSLAQLSAMHSELASVPPMFQSRVKRILPFLTHNVYLSNTRLASALLRASGTNDVQKQQKHIESCMDQSKPWEWLEDYVSERPHENDVPISLGLFHAKRAKREDGTYDAKRTKHEDNTYMRWFKLGFDDGLPLDADASPIRVTRIGSTATAHRRSLSSLAKEDPASTSESAASAQGPPKRRRIEMEEGEIP